MTTATELPGLDLPPTVVSIIRQGAAELARSRAAEQTEKEAKERAAHEKEQSLFVSMVDFVTDLIPEPLLPFVDFCRDSFAYPYHGGHSCYLNLPGLTRIAFGLGVNDGPDRRPKWYQGSAGFLVAVPEVYENQDGEFSVYIPTDWPMPSSTRVHGWTAYARLPLALAAAREQFARIPALETEAAAKNQAAEDQAAARERARADRKASLTPAEKLAEALRVFILDSIPNTTE